MFKLLKEPDFWFEANIFMTNSVKLTQLRMIDTNGSPMFAHKALGLLHGNF